METPRTAQQLPPVAFAFGKCLKNHAATTGGYAVDGCREFMPTDLTSLKCHACGCHRNFHCREIDQRQSPVECNIDCPHHHHPPTPSPSRHAAIAYSGGDTPDSPSPPPISSSYYPAPPPMFFAFNPGFPAREPAEKNRPSILTAGSNHMRKKRFRSKFSQYQKAKMQEFAERIGWKMVKREEEAILGFCKQIGVDKGVFKVWMHNHKTISIRDNNHQHRRDDGSNANGSSSSS